MSDAGLPVPVRLLTPAARLPERAYEHDAAWDLYAAEEATLPPLARAVVGTGIALGLPSHLAALTLPRSGLAARHGISIVNAPGLIDPGLSRRGAHHPPEHRHRGHVQRRARRPHRAIAVPAAH